MLETLKTFNQHHIQALAVKQPLLFCIFCQSALHLLTTITKELPFFAHLSVLYQAKRQTKSKKQLKKRKWCLLTKCLCKIRVSTYLSFIQILGLMSKIQHLVFIYTKISAHLMHQAMNRETTEYVWSSVSPDKLH